MPRKSSAIDFERSLRELEALVEKMETGNLSLEESLKCFERGIGLTRLCQKALTEAEQKVKILLEKEGRLETFDPPDLEGNEGSSLGPEEERKND
jgi:exodeoxyribonuclease VII small subunit